MIRVGVLGAGGRMGRKLIAAALEAGLTVSAAVDRPGAAEIGKDAGLVAGGAPLKVAIVDDLQKVGAAPDVFIDFTTPSATAAHAAFCARAGIPMVIGTTGVAGADLAAVAKAAGSIPIVHAANFSVGITALLSVVAELSRKLAGYDIEIAEIHHKKKVDAPSGTALRLAEAAAAGRGTLEVRNGRAGQVGPRGENELGLHALRGGDVVGDHTVFFFGPGERIELTHRAHSRDTFAAGAVRAASWVVGQKPGLYEMRHVLDLV